MSEMGELLKSLESRRPRLEDLLSTVLDTNLTLVSSEQIDENVSHNLEHSDGSEDFAADNVKKPSKQATEPVTRGKGKKKNNKAKKGKGGKKR